MFKKKNEVIKPSDLHMVKKKRIVNKFEFLEPAQRNISEVFDSTTIPTGREERCTFKTSIVSTHVYVFILSKVKKGESYNPVIELTAKYESGKTDKLAIINTAMSVDVDIISSSNYDFYRHFVFIENAVFPPAEYKFQVVNCDERDYEVIGIFHK